MRIDAKRIDSREATHPGRLDETGIDKLVYSFADKNDRDGNHESACHEEEFSHGKANAVVDDGGSDSEQKQAACNEADHDE